MNIKEALKTKLKEYMKSREQVRVETVRALISALQYEEMQKGVENLPESETIAVFKRELKKRNEELEFAEQGQRGDLIEKLRVEMSLIEEFLPQQLSEAELGDIVAELISSMDAPQMGMVMKELNQKYAGRFDGKLASQIVRGALG